MIGLSVDPGSVHVGLAYWHERDDRWRCSDAGEVTPDEYADLLWSLLNRRALAWVAIESFHLFGDKALQQTGSSFGEVELIGLTRHLCRFFRVTFKLVSPDLRDATYTKAKARGYRFSRNRGDQGHSHSATSVGLSAIGWSVANHTDGDGVGMFA